MHIYIYIFQPQHIANGSVYLRIIFSLTSLFLSLFSTTVQPSGRPTDLIITDIFVSFRAHQLIEFRIYFAVIYENNNTCTPFSIRNGVILLLVFCVCVVVYVCVNLLHVSKVHNCRLHTTAPTLPPQTPLFENKNV